MKFTYEEIPAELKAEAEKWREQMVEPPPRPTTS